jgi:hypothetical protein
MITEKQRELLKKLDQELDTGAREQLQALLIQLQGELAQQKLEASCETTEPIAQLVDYSISFEGRDGELELTYHNPNITDANLKASNVLKSFERGTATREFKVYRPNRNISSEKVIALMKKDGYRPATAIELLEYYVAQLLQGAIVRWFVLVALGTVWQGGVVCLFLDPTFRSLNLDAFDRGWRGVCEFLAVRESK